VVKYAPIACELIQHMGSDLTVANAARVSFHKEGDWDWVLDPQLRIEMPKLSERDRKLILYLARHYHWTPFGHVQMTFRIKAPIFLARQLGKHQVGFVWNEVSRRYVDEEPEFWMPETWRARAANAKQGSSRTETIPDAAPFAEAGVTAALNAYDALLSIGVCPEQARMVLPQNMMTEWWWTGSLAGFLRVITLRLDEHSQAECALVAEPIRAALQNVFPVSLSAHEALRQGNTANDNPSNQRVAA
jgi:thymidylate synthase (FAD)